MGADAPAERREPRRPHRRLGRWLVGFLAVVGLLVLLVAGGLVWLFSTEGGARFALEQAQNRAGEGIELRDVEGTLGGVLRIGVIEVSRPDLYARVEGFEMEASPLQPLRGLLHVERLRARSVEVRTADTGTAATLPASFSAPYPVRLDQGSVGELRLGDLSPEAQAETDVARRREIMKASRDGDLVVRDIFLRGSGDEDGWRIDEARAQTPQGKASLSGTVGAKPPFEVDLKAAVEGVAAERAFKADIAAGGSLKALKAQARGEVSGQRLELGGLIEPFAETPVRSLELRAPQLDLSKLGAGPQTRLSVQATLAGEGNAYAGPVRIENADPGRWDRGKLPFTAANARVVVRPDRVDVRDLSLALLGGGSASGRVAVQESGVQADLRVADVDLSALHGELQPTRVTGRISAEGDRERQDFEVALKDPRFEVEGRGALADERLEVRTATIRTGGGSVVAEGRMALAGDRAFRFEGRARNFDPSAFATTAKGDLNFTFVASGALGDTPTGELAAKISPSTYAGLPASGQLNLAGSAERIARADVNLVLGGARVEAHGSYGGRGDAMNVAVRAPNLSALAKPFGVAVSGKLDLDARVTGTFRAPAGRVSLSGANLTLPSNVYVRSLTLRAEAGVEPDSPIDATLQASGVALGEDTPPTPFAEAIQATLEGTRRAHRLEVRADLTRQSQLQVALRGGLDPRARTLAWDGRIESLSMRGPGAFAMAGPTPLYASAERVEVGGALLKGEWGEARLAELRWTPRTLVFRGSSPGIRIHTLARQFRVEAMPSSDLVVAADWDVRSAETFNANVDLRRISGDLRVGEPALPLGLRELVLNLKAVGGRAQATLSMEGERTGRMRGQGSATIVRGDAGWQLAPRAPVQGRLVAEHTNLNALSPWLGVEGRLAGRLDADLRVSGTGADPKVSGEVRAAGLGVREPQSGFEIEQGQLVARLDGQALTIERLSAVTPWRPPERARERFGRLKTPESGTLSAEGHIDLERRVADLRIKAQQAVLTQLPSRFLAVSGEARLRGDGKEMLVTGRFKADAGWVGALETPLPSVSEDVVVIRAEAPAAEEAPKPGEKIRIDARFALGEHVYFEGRGLDTRLTGELHITGTVGGGLRAVGAIRTVEGTYQGYGQKLTIERGVLQFDGPLDNPRLNVLALRKGLPVEAGVEVQGTASRPRVRLVSSPDVPDPEKLSWLVLGRGPSELAPGDASVLLAAATSMLGRDGAGTDMAKRFGVDEVKVGRADTGSILGALPQSTVAGKTGSPSAAEVVSVGKKLTDDIHLTYEQGLADAEGALKLTWQITRHFQLLLRGGFLPGIDAVYRWTFK